MAHDRPAIEVWARDASGAWSRTAHGAGETATLDALDARLDVDRVYADAAERD